uniref:Uncharacterized protein n=1 Tax=Helianthus annuus TaxID=4232 RepID=A0A251VP80_HELAN
MKGTISIFNHEFKESTNFFYFLFFFYYYKTVTSLCFLNHHNSPFILLSPLIQTPSKIVAGN